jgi:hypothetical protein
MDVQRYFTEQWTASESCLRECSGMLQNSTTAGA